MVGFKHHNLERVIPEKASCPNQAMNRISMHIKRVIADQAGFSLVELIAVIVILSVLAAIALPMYIDLDENARERAIDAGISELNGREGLAWSNIKLTPTGWQDDTTFFDGYDKNLGEDYYWSVGDPTTGGGEIKFGISGTPITLTRTPSTTSHPGRWKK